MLNWKSKATQSYDSIGDYARNTSRSNMALGIAVVVLAILAFTKQTTQVVVPCEFNSPIVIKGNVANKEYKVQWGLVIASMLGNINDKNAAFTVERIVRMIPPELDPVEVERQLIAQVEELQLRGVRQDFTITDAIYSNLADVVWIYGDKNTTSIRSGAQDTSKWTYEIRVGSRAGMPKILDIQQYDGVPNPSKREREILMANDPRATIETEAEIIQMNQPAGKQ